MRVLHIGLMKGSISYTDAYGLGLIARNAAGVNRQEIVRGLGPEARRIGMAIITTGSTAAGAKSAAKKSSKSRKKARAAAG